MYVFMHRAWKALGVHASSSSEPMNAIILAQPMNFIILAQEPK